MAEDFDHPGAGTASSFPTGFRAAVSHALAEWQFQIRGWERDGVNVVSTDSEQQFLGLSNLYRRAKAVAKTEWPALIRSFLRDIIGALTGPKIPHDLTTVASQLRPRLGQPFTRQGKAHPWGLPLHDTGLEINLVIDYPNTMAYVTDDMLAKAGQEGEELLELALANLKADTPDDFFEKVCEELDIHVGHCGDGYDAARALLLEELLPESPAGFLVALPSREELLVWPVTFAALSKIHVLKLFAQDNFRDHAYPITDEVFWVWNGAWHPFGITLDEKNVTVSPPEEFLAVLKDLECDGE